MSVTLVSTVFISIAMVKQLSGFRHIDNDYRTMCVCYTTAIVILLRYSRPNDCVTEGLLVHKMLKWTPADIRPVRSLMLFLNKRTVTRGSH
jgi:hypothetical protein